MAIIELKVVNMVINNGVHDGCSYNLDVCWVSLKICIANVTTAVTARRGLKAGKGVIHSATAPIT